MGVKIRVQFRVRIRANLDLSFWFLVSSFWTHGARMKQYRGS